MSKKYDYTVYCGRFQPFHKGHYSVVKRALEISENLIIIIGSHNKAPDIRNPLNSKQRVDIIKSALTALNFQPETSLGDILRSAVNPRIHYVFQEDHLYNEERWISGIQTAVNSITMGKWRAGPIKVGIIGYSKDHTTYYMKKFPQWDIIDLEPEHVINATDIRECFFSGNFSNAPEWAVNENHSVAVQNAFNTVIQAGIIDEYNAISKYKESWKAAPYPVTFQTVDAIVTQSGHILLVERGAYPGKGLWALPGGFVNPTETLLEACLRELREETKLAVPLPVLRGSILSNKTFDHPERSTRGRTITHCYHIKLSDMEKLPKIKGSDDAKKAFWLPLSEFVKHRSKMFEDHYEICENMLGI